MLHCYILTSKNGLLVYFFRKKFCLIWLRNIHACMWAGALLWTGYMAIISCDEHKNDVNFCKNSIEKKQYYTDERSIRSLDRLIIILVL